MTIIIAILVFGVLVLVHEFGHYIVAVKSGIIVEEFAIGMGPKLFSSKRGTTLFSIRLLPIGGFCKMLGEDSASKDSGAFNQKSVGIRFAVISAGAIMNFLLAFVIVFILAGVNGYKEPVISELVPNYPATAAGLKPGDKLVSINNTKIRVYQDLQLEMAANRGEEVEVKVKRDDAVLKFNIKPKMAEDASVYLIGISSTPKVGLFAKSVEGYDKATLWETTKDSFWTMTFYVKSTVVGFVRLITFKVSKDEIAGPIGITQIIGNAYESGMEDSVSSAIMNIAYITALLSTNLGALNLFPLPALDGGRLVFLAIEALRRKPIDPEKEGIVHFIGIVLLMILMVYVAFNDVMRLFK